MALAIYNEVRKPIYDIPCEDCKMSIFNTAPSRFPKTTTEMVGQLKSEELLLTTRNKFKTAKQIENIYKDMLEIRTIHEDGGEIDPIHDCKKYEGLIKELNKVREKKAKNKNPIALRQVYKTQKGIRIKKIYEHETHNKKITFRTKQKGFEIPLLVQLPTVLEEQNEKPLEKYLKKLETSSIRKFKFLKRKIAEAKENKENQ